MGCQDERYLQGIGLSIREFPFQTIEDLHGSLAKISPYVDLANTLNFWTAFLGYNLL